MRLDELDEEAARLSDDDIRLQQTHDQESWHDEMLDAVRANPEDIPEEWLEDEYGTSKRQPMYVDDKDGNTHKVGYVIGFRSRYDDSQKPCLEQHWIGFNKVTYENVKI